MSAKRVLVLDDDTELVEVLQAVLREEGFEVSTANTPEQAMAHLAVQRFDALVSDINLDTKNGLRFLADVRATTKNPQDMPRVVVMSGLPMEDKSRKQIMLALGVDLVLRKPFAPETLIEYLHQRVETRAQPPTYDSRLVRPFHEGILQTITLNTGTEPQPGQSFVKERVVALGDFTGIITFGNNKAHGAIALTFQRETIEAIARTIFQDANLEVQDNLAADLAGELCNQVSGMTQCNYSGMGARFEISTPTLVSGRGHVIAHKLDAPCLVLPFLWKGLPFFGEFVLAGEVPLQEEAGKPDGRNQHGLADSGDVVFFRK